MPENTDQPERPAPPASPPTTVVEPDDDASICMAIVELIARCEGVDPTDIDRPLNEVVDTDALDRLFDPGSGPGQFGGEVSFRYCGYAVTVDGRRRIVIED